MYTIILADGQSITDLKLNGTNYVSKNKIDEKIFEHNLSTMTISDGKTEIIYKDMTFVQQMEINGEFYLAFRSKTKDERLTETIINNSNSITDIQLALADVFETVQKGK